MRLDVRAVDHLHLARSPASGKLTEQPLPDTALGPAHKPIVDRRRRAILRRAILPAAAAPQNMQDAADDPAVVHTILAAHISRQVRLNLPPLIIAQPEEIASHVLCSRITAAENQQPIHPATDLLGIDPRYRLPTICEAHADADQCGLRVISDGAN